MSQSAEIITQSPSHPFKVKHFRMDEHGVGLQEYMGEVSVDMVTDIRSITAAEKRGLPVKDATGSHIVPWLTKTCIGTAEGNLYVMDELPYLLRMDPEVTHVTNLPEASQLIVAVQRIRPEIVQLPEIEIRQSQENVDMTPPDGAPYTPYRPKRNRQSLFGQITSTHLTIGAGIAVAGGVFLSVIAYENNQSDFWRSTQCEDLSSTSSSNAILVSRPSEGMQFTVDKKGRIFVSTRAFSSAKQVTETIGKVTGNYSDGYNSDISDSYRPDASAAMNVCLKRMRPEFK